MWLCADQRASHVTPWELSQQSATDWGPRAPGLHFSGIRRLACQDEGALIGLLGRACFLDANILLCGERH